uniref:Uncharacterized protein n=1 Tax=Romanomermis culicivorax TaxID=13658 RepID=A0A915J8J4_ROMCU
MQHGRRDMKTDDDEAVETVEPGPSEKSQIIVISDQATTICLCNAGIVFWFSCGPQLRVDCSSHNGILLCGSGKMRNRKTVHGLEIPEHNVLAFNNFSNKKFYGRSPTVLAFKLYFLTNSSSACNFVTESTPCMPKGSSPTPLSPPPASLSPTAAFFIFPYDGLPFFAAPKIRTMKIWLFRLRRLSKTVSVEMGRCRTEIEHHFMLDDNMALFIVVEAILAFEQFDT